MSDDLRNKTLDELAQTGGLPRQERYYAVQFEFQRRQTKAQVEAAEYAKQSVRWMFWSVVVLATASVGSFILAPRSGEPEVDRGVCRVPASPLKEQGLAVVSAPDHARHCPYPLAAGRHWWGREGREDRMEKFGSLKTEQVIVSFAVAVAAAILVNIGARLGPASWRWAWHFISSTRRQRRYENYVEIRRRIRNEDYLRYKAALANNFMFGFMVMNFGVALLIVLLITGTRPDSTEILVLVAVMLIFVGFVLAVLAVETARNDAARAFRARLTRYRRTGHFVWPSTKTPR